ncbi:hypothetical protein M4D51_07840 [Microbacterium sp. p3-SID338]|uniref:hypothetical protein n=1 Tax=Microbacterium sp. p3-SID338 TaxID=2916214 RepID=UPI0021A7EFD3|nr:hypothetical protein [Microbacterium sp. p3-SID338]MCT1395636.1 hypothetical protein [Microbacterium sp. p3-SID338]
MATTKPTLAEIREALPTSTAPDDLIQSPFFHLGRLQEAVKNEPSLDLAARLVMAALVDGATAIRTLDNIRFAVKETGA